MFEWRTKLACSQCSISQVSQIKDKQCKDVFRHIKTLPKDDALCIIDEKAALRYDNATAEMPEDPDFDPSIFVYPIVDEIEECSMSELLSNAVVMDIIKKIIIIVFCLSSCCVAIMCSYFQLTRKYDQLETRRQRNVKWLELLNDPERGPKLKEYFSTKFKGVKKELHKGLKTSTLAMKKAVQKKRDPKFKKVEMEEF